ncbi:MAG: ABC transporter permease [Holophagaceae bacterium]|nr:ABC transporter permease [Holophagaceae bacterium]
MLLRLRQLIIKELKILLGEKRAIAMLMMPVILQIAIFPFAANMEVRGSAVAIFNEDGGAESAEISQRIAKTAAFTSVINVYSHNDLRQVIDKQQALLAVHFPQDFSRSLLSLASSSAPHNSAQLQIILDGRRSNSGQIAGAYISQIVGDYMAEKSPPRAPALLVRNAYNPNLNFKWHILPCLVAIITTVGCLNVTALSVAREKEEGTLDQLLVSPLTPAYIMVGKAIPGIQVAVGQACIIALTAIIVYGVPFTGSLLLLLLSMVIYGIALSGVGLFISSICSTQQQAFLGLFAFMIPAMMLSGFVAPIENMPRFLQLLSKGNPISYFIPTLKGLFLKQFALTDVLPLMWPMLLIAFFTFSAGLWMFKRNVG